MGNKNHKNVSSNKKGPALNPIFLPIIPRMSLAIIRIIVRMIKRSLKNHELDLYLNQLLGTFPYEERVIISKSRVQNLKNENYDLKCQNDRLRNALQGRKIEADEKSKEIEKLKEDLKRKNLEILKLQNDQQDLYAELENLDAECKNLRGEKSQITTENENLRNQNSRLEKELQLQTTEIKYLEKKLQENSLANKVFRILKTFFPKMEFVNGTTEIITFSIEGKDGYPSGLEVLGEIHYNGGEMKATKVESTKGWKERHLGEKWRLYFLRAPEGKIKVLISHKNTQRQDIEKMRRLEG